MDKTQIIAALSALAQESRLDIFRSLVERGEEGMPAGKIGELLGVPAATLSFHLKTLRQAGLIDCRRESRSLIYCVNLKAMDGLIRYLSEDCCRGEVSSQASQDSKDASLHSTAPNS